MAWEKVKNLGGGHSLWELEGRLALCDESGTSPPDTDDGVLYLDVEAFRVSVEEGAATEWRPGGYVTRIPLVDAKGTHRYSIGSWHAGRRLSEYLGLAWRQ